jgi:glycosyltransferase involved in cell wall biosynthesis
VTPELFIVMPAYNEEASVALVVEEWLPVLRETVGGPFVFCALNDGSKDRTLACLQELAAKHPEVLVVDKPNSGHGQTCLEGYRRALTAGAKWVFQMDSDGQCDPRYFPALWAARLDSPVVYGYRARRDDGLPRYLISRVVSGVTLAATGTWVRDANVPYRLMHAETLAGLVDDVPKDFHLANIMLAALHQERHGIRWLDIGFRQRFGGVPSVKAYSFAKQGMKLFQQLRAARARAR